MPTHVDISENLSVSIQPVVLDQLLDGRYQVIGKLGRGGFGETYIAQDTRRPGHPKCVVKHLKPLSTAELDSLDDIRRLFSKEAETLEKLGHHDQIPRLLAHFEKDREFYLVQEFIKGHPLSQELLIEHGSSPEAATPLHKEPQERGDRWSESQVIQLLEEVLNILAFVHEHGIIHRDIKPENIIRRQQDQRLVLIDFGAVKHLQNTSAKSSENIARQSDVTVAINSAGYTPIEQIRGRPCLNSDIYALGMICIQALTGLHPRSFEESLHVAEVLWTQQAQVDPELVAILTTMTRYNWKDRYQTATEVLQDLQQLAPSVPEVAPTAPALSPAANPIYTPTQVRPALTQPEASSQPLPDLFPPSESLRTNRPTRETERALTPTQNSESGQAEQTSLNQRLRQLKVLLKPKMISRLTGIGLMLIGATIFGGYLSGSGSSRNTQSTELLERQDEQLITTLTGHSSMVTAIAFNADGNIASASTDKTIKVWDITLGHAIQTLTEGSGESPAIATSTDGKLLASSSMGNTIKVWNLDTGELLHTLRGHTWTISAIAMSPDGQTLVSSSEDNTIKIWDLETGELVKDFTGHTAPTTSMDISADGWLLVGGSADNTVKVWSLPTGELLNQFRGHSAEVHAVAISPNGATLVSGSADNTIKVWNLHSGALINTLSGHLDEVYTVAVSPNSQTLVSGSADNRVKLWNLYTGEPLYTFRGHTSEVHSVSISPDGQTIASGSWDRTIKLWRMPQAHSLP
ncbi:serine/threonine protein kinase [Cyanobacteria bacterium FACHB-471]|nr:serine/threonine protein kinase [Cyanobacteria bacterium FACHB-471]